jgi:hypothetical protein
LNPQNSVAAKSNELPNSRRNFKTSTEAAAGWLACLAAWPEQLKNIHTELELQLQLLADLQHGQRSLKSFTSMSCVQNKKNCRIVNQRILENSY